MGALKTPYFKLIHGPPGTGKSEVLVTILEALVKKGLRVLVCSEANNPVDNLLTRFAKTDTFVSSDLNQNSTVIRLGNSLLIDQACKKYCLEYAVNAKIKDILNKANNNKSKSDKPDKLTPELIAKVERDLLSRAKMVFSTQCSLYKDSVRNLFTKEDYKFDYVIIDEASQSFVGFTMMALSVAKKVIFAGDHMQLPPVIKDR